MGMRLSTFINGCKEEVLREFIACTATACRCGMPRASAMRLRTFLVAPSSKVRESLVIDTVPSSSLYVISVSASNDDLRMRLRERGAEVEAAKSLEKASVAAVNPVAAFPWDRRAALWP
eukprot:2273094-Rhodomonas_salina.1